jgi:hypothetical protein
LVAFGPADIASMEIIEKNNIGIQLNSSAAISYNAGKLSEMITLDEAYNEMVSRGYEYAVNNFSKSSVQGTLLRNL